MIFHNKEIHVTATKNNSQKDFLLPRELTIFQEPRDHWIFVQVYVQFHFDTSICNDEIEKKLIQVTCNLLWQGKDRQAYYQQRGCLRGSIEKKKTERTIANGKTPFRWTKQITLFCRFLCRHCTTTMWKCLISCLLKGGRQNNRTFLFFS